MKKGNMSLETLGKALLVLAVIIIILLILRSIFSDSSKDITSIRKDSTDKSLTCIRNPEDPKCQNWIGQGDDNQKIQEDLSKAKDSTTAKSTKKTT
jgi:hypothetical protein